jgi:hypothetical protein
MKKTIFLSFGFVFLFLIASAQPKSKKLSLEEIKAERTAFITQNLELTPDEAKAFWPIYTKLTAEVDDIKLERIKARRAFLKKFDTATDSEIDKYLISEMTYDDKIRETYRKYHTELRKVLPPRKILKLYRIEHQFKKTLVKRHGMPEERESEIGD